MLEMVSHNPRSAPVLGAAFLCGSQLQSSSWCWRGTQCFGGLPNLIATLRFVSGSLSKRDWAFAGGEGGPWLSLALSLSLLLGESRRAFATIFACRISLLIGYMTCQLRLGQHRGNMDSRMQDMELQLPPFQSLSLSFSSPTSPAPLLATAPYFALNSRFSQLQQLLLRLLLLLHLVSASWRGVASLSRIPAPISTRLFCLLSIVGTVLCADCFVSLVMSWFKPLLLFGPSAILSIRLNPWLYKFMIQTFHQPSFPKSCFDQFLQGNLTYVPEFPLPDHNERCQQIEGSYAV